MSSLREAWWAANNQALSLPPMESKEKLINLTQLYLQKFPMEQERCREFLAYLHRNETPDLYTRKNFDGHITASVFVISSDKSKVLLVHHKILNRWLQPGGHIEEQRDKTIYLAALRECLEETGIESKNLQSVNETSIPFDIDSHRIPANAKKQEAAHYHHDFRYLFVYKGEAEISIAEDESNAFTWRPLSELGADKDFELVSEKINLALQAEQPS